MKRALLMCALAGLCGCNRSEPATFPSATTTSPAIVTTSPAVTTASASTRPATTTPPPIDIRYRAERHTEDGATADFVDVVDATLADARGWSRARLHFRRETSAPYLIVLAEGDEVDRLCLPYDTYGKYSCQNGSVVALNADRWRQADPKWTGDLPTYRQMLVNHEVGHLLGQKHPHPQCPRPGQLAPVMNQQSTELDGCLPNPWPLAWEIELAARHDRTLAPPPDR